MKQLLAILFATGFTFTVCLLAGKLVLQYLRVKLAALEEYYLAFVTGAACLSTVVFVLTVAGQAHRGVFLALGLVIIALAIRRGAHRFSTGRVPALPSPWKILFGLLYATFAILYIVTALQPEASPDGVSYHVALAARYLREHHFPTITTNFTASYPEAMEMLFLFAFAFGRHTAAAMVHLLFLLITPVGIVAYGRRIGSPVAGAAGALIFFLMPIAGKTGTSAYVDVALASAVFAVFLLLAIWRDEPRKGLLAAIGICAGFAYGIKYTGGLAILYAVCAVAFHLLRIRKGFVRRVVIVGIFSLMLAAPWLIKNAIVVANPVSPFANRLFPNPYVSIWSEKNWAQVQKTRLRVSALELPLELTMGGGQLYGIVGPIFLLSPILLLGLGQPAGRRIAWAAVFFAIPCLAAPETRYWIPSVTFAGIGMALAMSRWRAVLITIVILHALASWPSLMRQYVHPYAWRIDEVDWKAALRITPEAEFLKTHLADYDIGLAIDKIVPDGQPVFSFSGIQQAYQSHEVIVEWTSSFGVRTSETLRTPFTNSLQPGRRYDFRFPPVEASKIRLTQTAASGRDRWNISELRVFHQGAELPRAPGWRIRASSNPWDSRLAFDNNEVTRWTSYEAFKPGMFVEIDFGRGERIDQVAADCSRDQEGMSMRLEYQIAGSEWRNLPNGSIIDIQPSESMRRAAIQEVERNQVHWLLVHDLERERGASDFFRYQTLWGIRLAASVGQYKLYHLE